MCTWPVIRKIYLFHSSRQRSLKSNSATRTTFSLEINFTTFRLNIDTFRMRNSCKITILKLDTIQTSSQYRDSAKKPMIWDSFLTRKTDKTMTCRLRSLELETRYLVVRLRFSAIKEKFNRNLTKVLAWERTWIVATLSYKSLRKRELVTRRKLIDLETLIHSKNAKILSPISALRVSIMNFLRLKRQLTNLASKLKLVNLIFVELLRPMSALMVIFSEVETNSLVFRVSRVTFSAPWNSEFKRKESSSARVKVNKLATVTNPNSSMILKLRPVTPKSNLLQPERSRKTLDSVTTAWQVAMMIWELRLTLYNVTAMYFKVRTVIWTQSSNTSCKQMNKLEQLLIVEIELTTCAWRLRQRFVPLTKI